MLHSRGKNDPWNSNQLLKFQSGPCLNFYKLQIFTIQNFTWTIFATLLWYRNLFFNRTLKFRTYNFITFHCSVNTRTIFTSNYCFFSMLIVSFINVTISYNLIGFKIFLSNLKNRQTHTHISKKTITRRHTQERTQTHIL